MKNRNVLEQAVGKTGGRGWLAVSSAVMALAAAPGVARGCACGCGVFDVATEDMFPKSQGGMVYVMYNFQDQRQNWSELGPAPAANNGDLRIATQFTTYGGNYMFNSNWGIQAELPYDFRSFTTTGGLSGSDVVKLKWSCLGDARVQGIYTGLSPDLETGLTFGLKLPTGSFTHEDAYGDIDRDSEIGTGSTDILLGAFHHHKIKGADKWTWYAQGLLDVPVLTQDMYRPGVEFDSAAGVYYSGLMVGRLMITPVEQIIASVKTSDTGAHASGGALDGGPGSDSGYERIMLSQGFEFHLHPYPVSFYTDVEAPVFKDFRGNQLVASWMFKAVMSYHF